MSSIHFESTYDNSKLIRGINQDNQTVGQWAKNIQSNSSGVEQSLNRVTAAAGAYLSLDFAGRIGKEIISVRGEFQQLGIAFETMLGSKEKADKLMAEQIKLSQKTPYTLTDVATNTKQLMAMGIGYEKVMQTMKDLGNVAAGVSVPLSRVAINYGQVATLGTLQQREIRDFAMAGIPIIDELAKNLGKAKGEIMDMVTAGQIGFPEVEKAFQTMSGEGGKFYNLMERQNASVTGQISNLTDKMQVMANEIGKSNEGLIYGGIEGLSSLVSNYKEVGEIILELAGTYGVYKTAVMVVSAAQAAEKAAIEEKKAALIEENALKDKAAADELKRVRMETAAAAELQAIEDRKQAASAKTIQSKQAAALANEKLIASEKAYAISSAEASAAYGVGAATEKQLLLKKELAEVEKNRIAASKANIAVEKAITAETVLNSQLEAAAVKKAEAEKIAATQAGIIAEREQAVAATVATGAEIRAAQAKKLSAAAQELLNATMLNNPYVLATVALGALVYGTYKYLTYQTELEKATSKMNIELENERDKINSIFSDLKLTTEGTKEHEAAKKKLIDTYGQYIPEQNKELKNLHDIKIAYDEVNKSISENVALRTRDELKTNISETYNPKIQDAKKGILEKLDGQQKSDAQFLLNQFIEQSKQEGLTYEQAQKARSEFMKKFDLLDSKGNTKFGSIGIAGNFYAISDAIIEMNQQFKEADDSFNKFISDAKKGEPEPPKPELITAEQERVKLRKQLVDETAKLKKLESTPSLTPLKDIEDQKLVIKDIKEKLGISTKQKKETDELKVANEALEKAIKSGNQVAITAASNRLNQLEKEKKLLEETMDLELKKAWRRQFDGQPMAELPPIGPKPIVQIGQRKQELQYSTKTNQYETVTLEITAIDKTGPVWKKVKLQDKELQDSIEEGKKKAKKDQEDIDKKQEKADEKKKETQKQLIDGGYEIINQLIDQSNLTESQANMMREVVSLAANLASGDYVGAGVSFVSGLLAQQVAQQDLVKQQVQAINDLYKQQNYELERQLDLLAQSSGSNRTDQEKRTLEVIKEQQKELEDAARLLEVTASKKERSGLFGLGSKTTSFTDRGSMWSEQADIIEKWNEYLTNVDSYSKSGYTLTGLDEVTQLLEQYKVLQEERKKLLEEFTATTSDDIASTIIDGFAAGKDSMVDFAGSFEELMKNAILNSFKTQYLMKASQGFFDQFASFTEGGLTKEEIDLLRTDYQKLIEDGKTQFDNLSAIANQAGINLTSGSSISSTYSSVKGIAAGATEETVSAMVGQMMGARVDIKALQEIGTNQLDIMTQGIQHLSRIEKNTNELYRLSSLETKLDDINDTLKKGLSV